MHLHQIWMQGEDQVPAQYRSYARRLRALHPEYQYTLWDDTSLRRVCYRLGQRYGRAYDACLHMHQRVDFGRYCVILMHGGISVDMDVEPLKSFDHVVRHIPPHTLGVSQFPMSTTESSLLAMRPHRWWLNNATLIAPRADLPAAQRLVDRTADRLLAPWWRWMPASMAILYTTGPMAFNTIFMKHIPRHEWTMIPYTYFEPCSGFNETCRPGKDSLVNHEHSGTWQPGWHGWTIRQYYRIKRHPWGLPLMLSVIGVVCIACVMRITASRH